MISLIDVYTTGEDGIGFLYNLLAERKVSESISHKRHPSFQEHKTFVQSRPYLGWYIIMDGQLKLGTCYITKYREVGIWLMPSAQGRGAGREAMRQLLAMYPGRVFTNTSIHNPNAFRFYEKAGFRYCANMLECDNAGSGDRAGEAGVDAVATQGVDAAGGNAGSGMGFARGKDGFFG